MIYFLVCTDGSDTLLIVMNANQETMYGMYKMAIHHKDIKRNDVY